MNEQFEPQFNAVYFHINEGALSEMAGGIPMLYVGMSYRIAREKLEEAERIFQQTQDIAQVQEVLGQDDVAPQLLLNHVSAQGFMPMPNAILERFDTVDSDSGDILVLLRVPCIPLLAEGGQEAA